MTLHLPSFELQLVPRSRSEVQGIGECGVCLSVRKLLCPLVCPSPCRSVFRLISVPLFLLSVSPSMGNQIPKACTGLCDRRRVVADVSLSNVFQSLYFSEKTLFAAICTHVWKFVSIILVSISLFFNDTCHA